MDNLEALSDRIRESFERQNRIRDEALAQSRNLTRHAARAIRAIHRNDADMAREHLSEADKLAKALRKGLSEDPDLYYSGYAQDALKEYCEAHLTVSTILDKEWPSPEDLQVPFATYLNGLSEVVGELRRRIMDIMREGHSSEVERLLDVMDEIYAQLVTMDFPDALTYGLRRRTDIACSIIERTQADVTISYRQQQLEKRLTDLSDQLFKFEENNK
ncbi:MAG: haloacid dehalogenase [Chloroflexota bacterium]|jgi:translin|nr:haloacid dehalogenase [Chloroflexota bacterium]